MPTFRIIGVFVVPHTHNDGQNKPPIVGAFEELNPMKALQNKLIADGVDISKIEKDLLGFETLQADKPAAFDTLWPVVRAKFGSMHLRSAEAVYKVSQAGTHHEGRRWIMMTDSGWDHATALKKMIDWGTGATQVRVIIGLQVHEL